MGAKSLKYYNLVRILDNKHKKNIDFAKDVGIAYSTLTMKLIGSYDFKLDEMLKIQKYIENLTGTKYALDYLFKKE